MRFAATHKATSYAAVTFAFLALVGGGQIAAPIVLFGALGLIGSWFLEPPRVSLDRYAWAFTALAVIGFAYAGLLAVSTGDYLGHGGGFLVILMVARAATRRTAREWQQLYLVAFLMLIAGTVLSGDLGYAVCFFGFVITATWAVILFHLRREMEDNFLYKHADPRASQRVEIRRILESRRIVDRRFLVGTGLTSVGFLLLALVFFLAIPRVGTGFFFRGRGGQPMVGFSDGVKLGGHGRLKTDATIVMRVQVDAPAARGRGAAPQYWRGVAFDHYSRGQWARSRAAPESQVWTERLSANRERRSLVGPIDASGLAQLVEQDIWLEPIGSDVLFAASMPAVFEVPVPSSAGRPPRERNGEIRLTHEGPIHYRAWSYLDAPGTAELDRPRRPDYDPRTDPELAPYLQVPPEITPATVALAQELTAGATTDYQRATRLRDWLQTNLSYSLDLRDPGGREPIDFFLFERKAGHCEYFASAFAIMARAVGVPTRSVNGFLGGEWNEYDGYVAVRAGDAHSWTEVWIDGYGWVTFDATPPGNDALGRGSSSWTAKLRRWFDTLRFQWNKWVIDYDFTTQLALFRGVGKKLSGGGKAVGDAGRAVERFARRYWAGLAALAIGVGLVVYLRRRRRRPPAEPRAVRARARERIELARLWTQTARRLGPRAPSTTPRELARELAARGDPGAAAFVELTELYYAGQWGGEVDAAGLARARALAADVTRARRAAR
ncbi:MAG: DUF3488 domain-containing protein [Kofleriaceae bacterium]|jgi:transglutaminase-like putative cysteine protease|nr:DUF3488 domain-containing protein [Kofleriaceae bacterium]MBP9172153.1 DUF3488 domain-containing protein [Kofleriaceae bacterium]MBP9858531.1 DUF3488 domain-containing protein [Kofleriaceae bacterium]